VRPRIGLLVDYRRWAIGLRASSLEHYLSDEFNVRIFTLSEVSRHIGPLPVDLVVALSFGLQPVRCIDRRRVLVFIGSFTWLPTPAHVAMVRDTAGLLCCNRQLHRLWQGRHRRVLHMPFTVDTRLWFPPLTPREHRLPLVVGFAGTVERAVKGMNDILRPAIRLAQGPRGRPRVILRTCGTDSVLISVGQMREEFYHQIDVLAVASSSEGGPNPLLEAMACGVPVVACSVGIVPEVVRHEQSGWVVDRRAKAFADRFTWLTFHPHEIDHVGMAAQEVAQKQSWERHVERWKDVIREVLRETNTA
jgi:glycosyltransferase involved in cell wall biosynthesis